MKKEKKSGLDLFEEYYSSIFGNRWNDIKKSFGSEPDYIGLEGNEEDKYYIDSASVLCAGCLPLDNAGNILDMCAAPGGKTLVLARRMKKDAVLIANERSKDRYMRLAKVVNSFLPEEINRRIKTICNDGAILCQKNVNKEFFDSILLDAPCSSERHVYNDNKYLELWTKNRIKTLSMTQWSLLSSGFLMLKRGGFLLYSTCALTSMENDDVIYKLLKKYKDAAVSEIDIEKCSKKIFDEIEEVKSLPSVEKTEYGCQILPDKQNGAGPIYFCLIQKI